MLACIVEGVVNPISVLLTNLANKIICYMLASLVLTTICYWTIITIFILGDIRRNDTTYIPNANATRSYRR